MWKVRDEIAYIFFFPFFIAQYARYVTKTITELPLSFTKQRNTVFNYFLKTRTQAVNVTNL